MLDYLVMKCVIDEVIDNTLKAWASSNKTTQNGKQRYVSSIIDSKGAHTGRYIQAYSVIKPCSCHIVRDKQIASAQREIPTRPLKRSRSNTSHDII